MANIHVTAILPAKPGSEALVREALTTLAAATRRDEPGCVSYDLFESQAAPGTFVTLEVWKTKADLDGHMKTPHIAAALKVAGPHLATAPQIHPLTPVVAG